MTTDPTVLPSVDAVTARTATGLWATGVAVVTARNDGRDVGLVMVSLAAVSQEPPLVAWSLDRGSGSFDDWLATGSYAVHLLAADQEALAWQFAKKGDEKFTGIAIRRGVTGAPLLDGAAAVLECVVVARHEAGDHVILVGRLVETEITEREPLLMHAGRVRRGLASD